MSEGERARRQRKLTPREREAVQRAAKALQKDPHVVRAVGQMKELSENPALLDMAENARSKFAKFLESEPFKSQIEGISALADRQEVIGRQIDAELAAKALNPEPIRAVQLPRNPMPDLLRDLVAVSREQTDQTRALTDSVSTAAREAAVRETRMFWITVASLAATVISVAVAIVALAG